MTAERATGERSAPVRSSSLAAWSVAQRPRSLPVALSPVLVGAAQDFVREGRKDLPAALLVPGCALLMQVVTSMQDDVGCTVRGGDSSGTRTSLPRATANGWLSVRDVRAGTVPAALVATALGLALVACCGWPVLAIGAASLVAALAYMGGPRPIACTPFGELTAFVFSGVVAVNGTDWVLTGRVGPATLRASFALGAIAAAALAVNALLFRSFRLELGFAALLSAGALLGSALAP